ncbi:hypothetical protein KPH14_008980 [Odynerus spinipes]|uniref:WD repeat-containing protein 63 n=1 Tax=Odynerus spinipes TaxID=1348599 RepID=A0AAD9RNN6_9HYME|nr:hypothetical protein KPH14_008980 [Odynerus spinipes]
MEGERSSDEEEEAAERRYEGYGYEDDDFFDDDGTDYEEQRRGIYMGEDEGEQEDEEEEEEYVEKVKDEEEEEKKAEEEKEEKKEEPEEPKSDEDWEREAKEKIHIDLVDPLPERRKTIFELDSYAATGPSAYDILQLGKPSTEAPAAPSIPKIRYSVSMGASGIARISLSPLTQKIVGCVIDENVTTEYPWIWVTKEILEDNLDLHSESSEFLSMKKEILEYPEKKMLIGYAPSATEEGQFYICLSTEAKEAVLQHIELQRREHENHVRSAVYKQPTEWVDLGSGVEVDENVIKNRRPLVEIELVSTADLLEMPMNLVDRQADDQRDGYINLLPYRQTFENVSQIMISKSTQVTPCTKDNDAQTAPSMPVNSWFQYGYEYKPIDIAAFTEEDTDDFKMFLRRYTNSMCDQVQVNATWDIYADDYKNLVRNERDTKAPIPIRYKEHQSFYDGKLIKNKIINDLSWHPLWTGIACATYTHHAKPEHFIGQKTYNEVLRDCQSSNLALIWSFNDCLSPKLILECPREITSISVCPFDGNLIIGGCASGQIALWSIPGKIENVEAVLVNTTAQVRYKVAMRTLMRWMRETVGSSVVRPVAMSSLQHSQKGAITQIMWIPSYHKVERNGTIRSLPANTKLEDMPWQFLTCSKDGSIAFWDLKENVPQKQTLTGDKKARAPRPAALVESISPYKAFDRVWKPYYILLIQYPNESRRPIISTMTMYNCKLKKELDEPFSLIKTDITIRRYYKLVVEKPDYTMIPEIFIGTVEGMLRVLSYRIYAISKQLHQGFSKFPGLVGLVTWEGLEFGTDLTAGREECKWKWMKNLHDGPITHIVRSKYHKRIVATIGGHVFAVWREDYGEPIIWKKSNLSYTGCSWGTFRPTVLILVRIDGTAEIWDFIVKSLEPNITQSVSGRIITGIYTHELPLDPQCVGFCDFNGTLRVFTAPPILLTFDAADIGWMQNFVDQQVDRVREFKAWQDAWNLANMESIDKKKKLAEQEEERKRVEAEAKLREEMEEMLKRAEEEERMSKKARKPWQFIEDVKQQWHEMEMKRMQITILEKKGLRREVLERQRAPVLKIRQEAQERKRKIGEILQRRDKIFEETVTFLFPKQQFDRKRAIDRKQTSIATTAPEELPKDEGVRSESVKESLPQKKESEEIIQDFLDVQEEALEKMRHQIFEHEFDWRNVIREGAFRRHSMEAALQHEKIIDE